MLEVNNLSFCWPEETPVFTDLSFRIASGEKVVLLGPNGCGKSTLLRIINGLIFAASGEVHWRGEALNQERLRVHEFARNFRRDNTLLFQHPEAEFFNPTVREEITNKARQLGLNDVETRAAHWAAALKLTEMLDLPPYALSGGHKQKLALACLLVLDPQFLALDEPVTALDSQTADWLVDTLLATDKTLLISTHNLNLAAKFGSRILVMNEKGALLYDGPLAPALTDPELLAAAGLTHHPSHHHNGASYVSNQGSV